MSEKPYRYDDHTINSSCIIARFSHRNRINKCLKLVLNHYRVNEQAKKINILDYGCGTGIFISRLNKLIPDVAIGYEPIMNQKHEAMLPIYNNLDIISNFAPFNIITIFEVLEHLQWVEINNILSRCRELLTSNGVILISVPIEIGPVVIFKEFNRYRRTKKWNYGFVELIKTFFLGTKGLRENPESSFMSHKGFDFRELILFLKEKNWIIEKIDYGPIPIKSWYGNSQVYLSMFNKTL